MKILQVIANTRQGGMPQHLLTLSMELVQKGHEIHVVSLSDGPILGEFEKAGINVSTAFFLGHKMRLDPLLVRKAVGFTRNLIQETRPDIVHTHGPRAHIIAGKASRFSGSPPLVATAHGSFRQFVAGNTGEFGWCRSRLKKFQYIWADRYAGRVANRLIAVCEATRRDLVDVIKVPAAKVCVIHNGIVDSQVRSEHKLSVRTELGLHEANKLITYVGRIAFHKGVPDLIKAAEVIVRKVPEARILIVGEGPLVRNLKDDVDSRSLEDKVIFTGERKDAVQIIAASDLFVLPSLSEGLALTLLEAAMTATAMVATDIGGNSEVVHPNQTGLLIPPKSPDALADAIIELLDDNERRMKMGKAARNLWQQQFTAAHMVNSIETLYRELLSG